MKRREAPLLASPITAFAVAALAASCGGTEGRPAAPEARPTSALSSDTSAPPPCIDSIEPYTPRLAYSGVSPSIPVVPQLRSTPLRIGDAFTVWGASHHLRSRHHREEVDGKRIEIIGYIVRTNYKDAPACAVHTTGKADPPSCVAPLPSFSIADEKGERRHIIDVMGWASNFAQIYAMIEAIERAPKARSGDVRLADEFWGLNLPNPIPSVGAKVRVKGTYGVTFTKSTSGAAANPKYGIMTAETIHYIEPPLQRATLPGMKPQK
jgi:hypothetical protein